MPAYSPSTTPPVRLKVGKVQNFRPAQTGYQPRSYWTTGFCIYYNIELWKLYLRESFFNWRHAVALCVNRGLVDEEST